MTLTYVALSLQLHTVGCRSNVVHYNMVYITVVTEARYESKIEHKKYTLYGKLWDDFIYLYTYMEI